MAKYVCSRCGKLVKLNDYVNIGEKLKPKWVCKSCAKPTEKSNDKRDVEK